jgi:glyoxylase-like metal-dependent hydrolase (beta-lactamase superfamily II)
MPQIGPYTLHAIETGRFGLDGGAMFGIVPKPLWQRRIPADDRNRIPLHMRCLLLEGDGRVILIDDGLGHKYDAKFADIYAIDHETHTLDGSLAAAGFAPEDVTDVVLTHLHFDHCGGSTRRDGDRFVPTFPQATYHVQRAHWAWAHDPNPKEAGSFFARNLDPLEASGQLHLVDGPGTLFPGVSVRLAHGHTEAQQVVLVQGAARTLAFAADLLPTHAHLAPAWTMAYDVRPLVTMDEKAAFLDEAVAAEWSLFFEHDPEVVVADLTRTERGVTTTAHRPLHEL